MSVSIKFHGGEFNRDLRRARKNGLREMSRKLYMAAQDTVNFLYPPASKKGEPPARRSGDGRGSIFFDVQEFESVIAARVGTTSERLTEQGRGSFNYMAYHETHGRSWLLLTYRRYEGLFGPLFLRTANSEMR